jgi:hypothetical protein
MLDVRLNVGDIFNSGRDANKPIANTQRGPFFRCQGAMG